MKNILVALAVAVSISNFQKVSKNGQVVYYHVEFLFNDGVKNVLRSVHIRRDVLTNPDDADEALALAKDAASNLLAEVEAEAAKPQPAHERMILKEGPVDLAK